MPVRGCGASRVAGGVYVSVPLDPLGIPLHNFIIDPPIVVPDPALLGITHQGMSFMPEPKGGWSLVDWVGEEFYPNVMDLLVEIRAYGLSRRVQRTLNFGLLGPKSRIYLLHSRAYIPEDGRAILYTSGGTFRCPKRLAEHHNPYVEVAGKVRRNVMCGTLWQEMIEGGEAIEGEADERLVSRRIGDLTYQGHRPPLDTTLATHPAFFASFPITRLEVVRDAARQSHVAALNKTGKYHGDVHLVEE